MEKRKKLANRWFESFEAILSNHQGWGEVFPKT